MNHQFRNDYCACCHPKVLEAITKYAYEQNDGYGLDKHSENAANLIKKTFGVENADVHFLVGGTQTNATFISYCLRDYEAVIAAFSGHINVHETGAVEATGHKIYQVKGKDGKVTVKDVKESLELHKGEHKVKLKMVYISDTTEIGSVYTKKEIQELYKVCKENGLYLFIDGARLSSALTSIDNDIKKEELGSMCDAFYIGGTKSGALFGEALVIINDELKQDFRYEIKNKGAMLAKGFVAGIMFEALFTGNLFFEIGRSENLSAKTLKNGLAKLGIRIGNFNSNQIFAEFKNDIADKICKKYGCEVFEEYKEKKLVRFVTSFLTKESDVKSLLKYVKKVVEE